MDETLHKQTNETLPHDDAVRQRDSDALIIEVVSVLDDVSDYNDAIPKALKILSRAVHADRLYVMEHRRRIDGRVFEWCDEGVVPRMSAISRVSDEALLAFARHFHGCGDIYADTLDKLGFTDPRWTAYFEGWGISSEMVIPLREGDRPVGALGADNYRLDEGYDVERILNTIAPFFATLISNRQLLEELEWAGTHDQLTELYNRRGVEAELSRRVEANPEAPLALALVDVDDFKVKNDLYGHAVGDEVLRSLANALRRIFPEGSILGRNGGDEMIAVVGPEHAEQMDELLDELLASDLAVRSDDGPVEVTLSIGYTFYPSPATTIAAAYKQADAALYAVKLAGKSAVRRYRDGLDLQYRTQLGFSPRDIAENIPGALMVHNVRGNGEILFVNEEMVRLVECDSLLDFMEHTHGDYRAIIHPDDMERVHEDSASQLGSYELGAQFFVDYRLVTKRGNIRDVAVNGRLAEGPGGTKVSYALVIDTKEHQFRHA
jgi:diguanylate cyclase (GGDEF)-like protein